MGGWNSALGEEKYVVNGGAAEAPLRLQVGVHYRLRFINIAPAAPITYRIERSGALTEWQLVAKDGADLPVHQVVTSPASKSFSVGETFDVYFTPSASGTYTLSAALGRAGTFRVYERPLEVRSRAP